jgi:hypothetical protein
MRLQGRDGQIVAVVQTDRVRKILEVTRKIEAVAGVNSHVLILDSKEPNAFASRGKDGVNRIGFTLGMLDLLSDDYDAYAAIIGHELAHLVLEHGQVRQGREATRSAASQLLGLVLGAAGVPLSGTVANVATTAVATSFTRDEERDADRQGIEYATMAGFDPHGAVRAWEKMAARSSTALLPFLSTHPMAEERIQTMRQFAATAPQPKTRPTGMVQPTPTIAAIKAYPRLRPIGVLHDVPNLPAGDLFVDMNSISPSPQHLTAKRAWFIVNLQLPHRERSYWAHALVNCPTQSLTITTTTTHSDINGEGAPIQTKEYPQTFEVVKMGSALASALNAVCE